MIHKVLLQLKFFVVGWLNFSFNLIPNPLRKYYLRIFGIKIGRGSSIHRWCHFFHIGKLAIGDNSTINFGCILDNRRGIYIGNNVGIAHYTKIYTLGHDINDPKFRTKGKPVYINDNSFIFSNSLIMPGVTIGEGAIILAGSVVTKNVEPWTVVGGNPAKKVKDRKVSINYKSSYRYLLAL